MKDLSTCQKNLADFKIEILNIAKSELDKEFFCKLHKINSVKLWRILNGKVKCTDEMFFYICIDLGIELFLYYKKSNVVSNSKMFN